MRRLLVFALVLGAFLIACGSGDDDDAVATPSGPTATPAPATPVTAIPARSGGPAPQGVPAGMGSTASEGVFPRTVAHFGGTTNIPAEPKRVIVIATGQIDGVLTLGVVPIGAASALGASFTPDYITTAFPQQATALKSMVDIGSRAEPDFEKIAGLRPDLILANKAGSEKLYDKFAAIAPTVFTEGTGVNWKQDFLLVAAALGKTGKAQTFLNDYHTQAAALATKVASKPVAVSMVRFNPGRTRMFGVSSFGGSIAYDAGLGRPAPQQFNATSQDLSLEQVNLMDGDWIFYSIQTPEEQTDAAKIVGQQFWNGLAAVKAGHVLKVDDDPWYLNAGPTAAMLVLKQLTAALGG